MNDHGQSAAPGPSGGARRPGLRERNKEKKLERIVRAGRGLFVQKGFERTTTRAIAARAGVASGTFFLYFREKRDLLFHLFREDISAVQDRAFASLPAEAPLVDQFAHVFGRFYRYYGRDPRLSRIFLKELLFLEEGEREDMLKFTMSAVVRFAELAARAQERKEVARWVDPMQVAAHAFALYLFGLVGWLNGAIPTLEMTRAQLEAHLELMMQGIAWRRQPTKELAGHGATAIARRDRKREVRG